MTYLLNILIGGLVALSATIGVYNYAPLSFIEKFGPEPVVTFGATITNIAGTDTLKNSRSVINDNFTSLNNYKIENSTTSVAAITTLSNLVSIGTITTGTWDASTLTVSRGGTGSTTLAANLILLGNGTTQLGVVNGTGALNQFLTSQGAGANPIWTTSSVVQTDNYAWTGRHEFRTATTSIKGTNNGITINGIDFSLPATLLGIGSGTVATLIPENSGSTTIRFQQPPIGWEYLDMTVLSGSAATVTVSNLPARREYQLEIYISGVSSSDQRPGISFNCCGSNEYAWQATSTGSVGGQASSTPHVRLTGGNYDGIGRYTLTVTNPSATKEKKLVSGTGVIDTNTSNPQQYPTSEIISGRWASTTVITTISLVASTVVDGNARTFNTGTYLMILGSRN